MREINLLPLWVVNKQQQRRLLCKIATAEAFILTTLLLLCLTAALYI